MELKVYQFGSSQKKLVEKLIDNDEAQINHIILPQNDSMPEHYSNSNVYLIVVGGSLSLTVNGEETFNYNAGSIVNVPYKTKMLIENKASEVLEFFVVKAPSPRCYTD